MNAPDPAPTAGASPALAAFLRGTGRRALLFADLHAGPGSDSAVSAALPGFVVQAARLPMSRWPARFWGLLLESPAMRVQPPGMGPGSREGDRVAALLWLVAGLDEEDAAAALGVAPQAWRLAVQRAAPRDNAGEVDAAAWQAWSASVREGLREIPSARLDWWEHQCRQALRSRQPASALPGRLAPRWLLPTLWGGVGLCALGLAASFIAWPPSAVDTAAGNKAVAARSIPLPAAGPPAATFDDDFALHHHRDLELLAGADESLLRDLDFHAWHATRLGAEPVDAVTAAEPPPVSMPERIAAWQALPESGRALLRERWEAWRTLPATQRAAVMDAAATFHALAPDRQQELRLAFEALPAGERRGWLLGPRMGQAWPRLQPLLMQVPTAQREPLLDALHQLSPLQLDDLATLAQRTPPQERDALRRELLSTAEGNRTAWLRERLRR